MRDERKIKEEDFKTIIWKYNVKEAIEKLKANMENTYLILEKTMENLFQPQDWDQTL